MDKKKKILIPLLVALLGIFTFWYAISNYKSLFIFSGDNLEQEYLFILGGIKRIKAWNFSVYDWSAGFGARLSYLCIFFKPTIFVFIINKRKFIKVFYSIFTNFQNYDDFLFCLSLDFKAFKEEDDYLDRCSIDRIFRLGISIL